MKISVPETLDDYIQRTEHAVVHFYAGLESCWAYYQLALEHWDISQVNEPMTPERKAALDRYLALAGKYFNLKLSEAMFAGAILQMAYMAIRLYSTNSIVPTSCVDFVRPTQKSAVPFCIGREKHGVPVGLIVYAGRNQYGHWDEEEPYDVTKAVFHALNRAFSNNPFADLAFSLRNPTIPVYANEILLTALRWTTYYEYVQELRGLLLPRV